MNERIKELRKALGLNQTELGQALGVKQTTVAGWETGAREPSDSVILSICRVYHVDEVWLRTGEGEMFRQMSRDEEITKFIAETLSGSNEFKNRLIAALARLDGSDWEHLEQIARKMLDEQQK